MMEPDTSDFLMSVLWRMPSGRRNSSRPQRLKSASGSDFSVLASSLQTSSTTQSSSPMTVDLDEDGNDDGDGCVFRNSFFAAFFHPSHVISANTFFVVVVSSSSGSGSGDIVAALASSSSSSHSHANGTVFTK